MALVGNLTIGLSATTDNFTRGMKQAQQELKNTQTAVVSMQGTLTGLGSAFTGLAARVASVAAITRGLEGIVQAGAKLETVQVAFRNLTGSSQAGAAALEIVRRKADELGFGVFALADSYKELLAASRNTTMEGERTQAIFEQITNAMRAAQATTEQTQSALHAVALAMDRGVLTAENLREGFRALPGTQLALARALGVTIEELGRMATTGQLVSDIVIPRLGRQMELELGQKAASSTQTLTNATESFHNAITELSAAIATSGVTATLAGWLQTATRLVQTLSERHAASTPTVVSTAVAPLAQQYPGADIQGMSEYQDLVRLAEKRQGIEREINKAIAAQATAWKSIIESVGKLNDPLLGMTQRLLTTARLKANLGIPEREAQRIAELQDRLDRVNEGYTDTARALAARAPTLPQTSQGPVQGPPPPPPVVRDAQREAVEFQDALNKKLADYNALWDEAAKKIALEPESKAQVLQQTIQDAQKVIATIDAMRARFQAMPPGVVPQTIAPTAGISTVPFGLVPSSRLQTALPLISQLAPQYGIDPNLVAAIAYRESRFNPGAVGPMTKYGQAQGMMQLIPGTAQRFRVEDAFDITQNLQGALAYLRQLSDLFAGDITKMLTAYHAGEHATTIGPKTRQYVSDVQATYAALQGQMPTQAPAEAVSTGQTAQSVAGLDDRVQGLRDTLKQAKLALIDLANQDVFAKIINQLTAELAQLQLSPEELQRTEVDRLNAAAEVTQHVREAFARDVGAAKAEALANIAALQELVSQQQEIKVQAEIRERQLQNIQATIEGLKQERDNLLLTTDALLKQRLALDDATEGQTRLALSLHETVKTAREAAQVSDFVVNTFIDMATGADISFKNIAQSFGRMALSILVDATDMRQQLTKVFKGGIDWVKTALGLASAVAGAAAGTPDTGSITPIAASPTISAPDFSGTTLEGLAEGGPVVPGKVYTVGERGPERFVSNQAGYIYPNGMLRPIQATFNIYANDPREIARSTGEVQNKLLRAIQQAQRNA